MSWIVLFVSLLISTLKTSQTYNPDGTVAIIRPLQTLAVPIPLTKPRLVHLHIRHRRTRIPLILKTHPSSVQIRLAGNRDFHSRNTGLKERLRLDGVDVTVGGIAGDLEGLGGDVAGDTEEFFGVGDATTGEVGRPGGEAKSGGDMIEREVESLQGILQSHDASVVHGAD